MASIPDLPADLLQSNHKFGLDIYQILAKQKENVVFSPISLQIAILTALSGGRGRTSEQMRNCLHLCEDQDEIIDATGLLIDHLNVSNSKLKIACQLFIGWQYKLQATHKKVLQQYLSGFCEFVNFERDPTYATYRINQWIKEKTDNEIRDIIDHSLSEDTCLLLVNAVYFKDNWRQQFPNALTLDGPFYSTEDNIQTVPMMYREYLCLRYLKRDTYRVVEIPYQDSLFRMLIMLPKENDGLPELEGKIAGIDFLEMFRSLEHRKVNLKMPKFKIEQQIDDLKDILKTLGMTTMFDPKEADFTEMYDKPDFDDKNLYVNDVCHKAIIEVNEQGTKAVGETHERQSGGGGGPSAIIDFYVDHPFIFLIRYETTILFMGKISSFA